MSWKNRLAFCHLAISVMLATSTPAFAGGSRPKNENKGDPDDNLYKPYPDGLDWRRKFLAMREAAGKRNDYKAVLEYCDQLVREKPDNPLVYSDRGSLRVDLKEFDLARPDFEKSLELVRQFGGSPDPDFLQFSVGVCALAQKDWAGAATSLEAAVKGKPSYVPALNALAWLRATCIEAEQRDGARAVEIAQRCCLLSGDHPNFVDTLAAAYAETGDFDRAVKEEKRALQLSQDFFGDMAIAKSFRELYKAHLTLYQAQRPYRDDYKN